MWPELLRDLEEELIDLSRLREAYTEHIDGAFAKAPNKIEILALASVLQSYYTGMENAMARIVRTFDGQISKSHSWHADLLCASRSVTQISYPDQTCDHYERT